MTMKIESLGNKHDHPQAEAPPAPQSSTPMLDALLRADGAVPAATFKPVPVKQEFPGQRFRHLRSASVFINLSDTPPRASGGASSQQDEISLPAVGEAPDEVARS